MGKRVLLALTIIMISAATACSSASSIDDRASDSGHAFLIQSAQVFDGISEDIAPEDEAYLIIKCQIENLQSQDDSFRRWADQITLEFAEESYAMTFINSLDDQLWETSLAKGEKKAGYIAFLVPEDTFQFDLTLTLPTSGTEVVYAIAALDKRISESVDWVLTRLGTIENNKKIPLIGEPLAMAQDIKYHGIILVPKEDISQLMEQTDGLPENDKRAVIEDYLLEHGHCRLE